MTKKERRAVLLELVKQNETSTQDELVRLLAQKGVIVTQATVSRDVRELGLVKRNGILGTGVYSADKRIPENIHTKFGSLFTSSILSVETAGHLVVIKCCAGMAQGVCATIDNLEIKAIVGTIAGDDTIFIACKTENNANELKSTIQSALKSRG